ncbi:isoleucyl-tRNA synthetase [Spiroplasma clarkii]|uniref:Isoleucine--tRNA ligase n=1 Tax=Spiroplasma clarkii TaxID=2139 RepID=A0A1Y0L0B9_9MOLU|nr:isoleucine--tRNA ligase [Spiroplasma clarkii]ARU91421.1 isoleucyl-tRNA synthetase [Spiroplasma clarkii]ATX70837.1 isoleucyl-tRNA synthetase [Spiroplasma clarkii]
MEKNYKDTLLMYQTDFDMKADLKTKEPVIEKKWLDQKIYQQKIALNAKKPYFILHDGPPYANGNIHVGHALNKILKDIIVRWKNSSGYNSPYIMGWDTHGLPIETAVTKTGVDRKALKPSEFRDLCKSYALEQVQIQSEQFRRLGVFTDYNQKYLTLTPDFEAAQLALYTKMIEKKLIYRDLKPIYWSPSSESALAEAEIEYADVKSPTIFVGVPIVEHPDFKNANLVIWTTTPWTIPANQLIAVGAELTYCLVQPKNSTKSFVVAKDLQASVAEQIGWEEVTVLKEYQGPELVGLKYQHPWYDKQTGSVVIGHHVSAEAGSGLVHTAGGFGEDDFEIVTKQGIKAFAPIDDQGKFDVTINDKTLEGVFYEDANKIIGQALENKGYLLKLKFVKHSYPHDWRTKKPVIYRATHQWFVSLEQVKAEIDQQIVTKVSTNPEWSKERLRNIIKDRNDWTISRQRLWGVPIIAFYDQNKQAIYDLPTIKYAVAQVNKLGTNAWFELPADEFLPKEHQNKGWTKEKDILDVWFDSGSSNIALEANFKLPRPFDVYLEGNDQYRGWFNSSMINSVIFDGKPAYKQLITHGMTNDEKGHKMSKSIGNTVDPLAIADDLGADVLRLWVFSTDFTDDQRIGPEILKQVAESYRKIRNTMRFMLANLVDFNPSSDYQKKLAEVDAFALHNLTNVKTKFSEAMNTYNFNAGFKLINNYVINDLSSFYLDFIKDIIYIEKQTAPRRRQVQTVLYEQLWALIDMLRVVLPHTIEEVYQAMKNLDLVASVHLLDVRPQDFTQPLDFVKKWNSFLDLRDDVNEALEKARNEKLIKKGFDAVVSISLQTEFENLKTIPNLSQLLIVNTVNFKNSSQAVSGKVADVKVEAKEGLKCQRCWAIFDELVADICQRCYAVIN